MKLNLKKIILSILFLPVVGVFTSCDDWTQPESLDIDNPSIATQNNELYQQYLTNLRNYKKTDHSLLLGWFDNSKKNTNTRADHLNSLPDSVDIVSLMYGDNLTDTELEEIKSLRNDKGTRVIYTVDCESIISLLEIALTPEEGEEIDYTAFNQQLSTRLDEQFKCLAKYSYDGVSVNYQGYSTEALDAEGVEQLQIVQDMIFDKLSTLKSANSGKLFLFEGKPQFVINTDELDMFDYIVINTYNELSTANIQFAVNKSLSLKEGVPSDRIIVTSIPFKLFDEDVSRGVFKIDGKDVSAIVETAYWVMTPGSFTKAGLGIYRINDDYYNADLDYKYTRKAIGVMNPSPKN